MDNNELCAVMQEEDQNSLEHYGVKGQKWGQRNYQNPDGSYTDLGKARRRVAYIRQEKTEEEKNQNESSKELETTKIGGKAFKDMTRKELRAAKKKARHNEKERQERREFNRDKRQALEDGDLAFISKNISRFSNEEIDEAVTRYKKMQTLKDLETANRKSADHYIDKALHFLEKADKGVGFVTNISNKLNTASKNIADKKKAWIDYEYAQDPSKKPLTLKEKEELRKTQESTRQIAEQANLNREKAREQRAIADMKEQEKQSAQIDLDEKKYAEKLAKDARKEAEEAVKRAKERIRETNDAEEKWRLAVYEEELKAKKKAEKLANREAKIAKKEAKQAAKDAKAERKLLGELMDEAENQREIDRIFNWRVGSQPSDGSKPLNGWFSKKDKDKYNKETNRVFDMDSKEINSLTQKYLSKLKDSNKDYFKIGSDSKMARYPVQDEKWKKEIKKQNSYVIDQWVKDMKKKYMKERNMDSKTAEKYAEEYVDAWIDAYDEGKI